MTNKKNNIYIIEGFDGVGKNYYVKENLSDKKFYRPDHKLFDKFIGRNDSYLIGLSIFDFLNIWNKTGVKVVINRCVASSLVYSEMYNGKLHLHKDLEELINFYKNNKHFQEANHIHICHADIESARKIYYKVNGRPDNDEFDEFDSFSEYWKAYCDSEVLFAKYYRMLGIKPTYVYNKYEEPEIESCELFGPEGISKEDAKNTGLCFGCRHYDECYKKNEEE